MARCTTRVLCLLEVLVRTQALGERGNAEEGGERHFLYRWRSCRRANAMKTSQAPSGPVRSGPSFRHGRFDRRKPLARPAEIYRKKRKKVQLRTVSVDFAVCQKFGAANFHGLDRPTVIRKATSQTTLSALEPAPSPAPKSRRRRVWRLATGDGPRTWPLVQDSTRRRHWEARAHRPTRVSILRPIKSPRIVPTARLT